MCRTKRWMQSVALGVIAVLSNSAIPVCAQTWPQRTVRVIMPLSAGSGANVPARLFAERFGERWKQPVVVENRPGADGLTGVAAFAALRDDHTLLYSPAAPVSVFPVTHEKLPYDPVRDVVPISSVTDTFVVVAVSESLKVGSLSELVALARSQPGKLNYSAIGGAFPIWFAGFMKRVGIDMVEISYREQSLAFQDLAEGRIQAVMTIMTPLLPMMRAGKVRFLAVTNKKRSPLAPAVPTATEAGYPAFTFEGLQGFFGPREIPTERQDRISADVRAIASDPAIADRLAAVGQIARGSTPAEFIASIEEQRAQIAAVVKAIGATSK